jgi:hypothetical protein
MSPKFVLSLTLGFLAHTALKGALIGDTINVIWAVPNQISILDQRSVIVQAGTSDQVSLDPGILVNPDAFSIDLTFLGGGVIASQPFNGLIVTGVDDLILGFSVSTNLAGWDNARFSFNEHSFQANFAGLAFEPNASFNVSLVSRSVPDQSTCVDFVIATIGLAAFIRYRAKVSR